MERDQEMKVDDRLLSVYDQAYTLATLQRVHGVAERRRFAVSRVINDPEFRGDMLSSLMQHGPVLGVPQILDSSRFTPELLIKPQLTLGQLIERLRDHPRPDAILRLGLEEPHSWRSDYSVLAFQIKSSTQTVGEMRRLVEDCLGRGFYGYKGGDMVAQEYTLLALGRYGESDGVEFTPAILELMLSQVTGFTTSYQKQGVQLEEDRYTPPKMEEYGEVRRSRGMDYRLPPNKLYEIKEYGPELKEKPLFPIKGFPERIEGFIDFARGPVMDSRVEPFPLDGIVVPPTEASPQPETLSDQQSPESS